MVVDFHGGGGRFVSMLELVVIYRIDREMWSKGWIDGVGCKCFGICLSYRVDIEITLTIGLYTDSKFDKH